MKEPRQQILARHRQNCEAESRLFDAAMTILPVSFAPSDFDDEIDAMQKKIAELGRKLKKHNDAMEDQLANALQLVGECDLPNLDNRPPNPANGT